MITPEMKSAGAKVLASAFEYAGCDDRFTLDIAERVFEEMAAAATERPAMFIPFRVEEGSLSAIPLSKPIPYPGREMTTIQTYGGAGPVA